MSEAPPPIPHPPLGTPEYEAWAAQDEGPVILTVGWTFVGLATVFVGLRLFVRGFMHKQLRSDDYWCLGGMFCALLSVSFTTVAVAYGNGKHYNLLDQYHQEKVQLWTTAAFLPGVMCFGFPKMAVVSLLTRLLNPSKAHKIFLWFLSTWCLLTLFATIGTLLGRCTPTRSMWDFDIPRTCVDPEPIVNFSIYAGSYSAFVDAYLALYPAVVLFRLQLKTSKKIALSAALGIGIVSAGIATYKTTRIPSGLASPDFSYDSSDLEQWTLVEGSTIIMACTIPVLGPLFELIFKGRNPFRSSKRQYEEYYDKKHFSDARQSCELRQSYEARQSQRRMRNAFHPDLETVIMGGEDSSQEDILAGQKPDDVDQVERAASRLDHRAIGNDQILRTSEVVISFESDETLHETGVKPRS